MKLSSNTSAEGTMVALRSDDDQLEPEGLIFLEKEVSNQKQAYNMLQK